MRLPDNPEGNKDNILGNYKQLYKKLKKIDNNHIENTDNKIILKELRDILVDVGKILKNMNGIHRDQESDI